MTAPVPAPARRLELIPLDELRRADRNPKQHADHEIQRSLERFGYAADMIGLDDRTGVLASGHGRLDALVALRAAGKPPPRGLVLGEDGGWLVPVIRGWASTDDAEADAYRIAANGTTIAGGWDEVALAGMLGELADAHSLDGTGFNALDVDNLLSAGDRPSLGDPDDAPEPPPTGKARCSEGQVWTVGRHRLAVGDNRSSDLLGRLMEGRLADAVWTDPPYGVDYEGKTAGHGFKQRKEGLKVLGDALTGPALARYIEPALEVALAHCRKGGAWFVTAPPGPELLTFMLVLDRLGVWRQTIVWAKDHFVLGRSDFPVSHEFLLEGEAPTEAAPPEPSPGDGDWQPVFYGWRPGARHRVPTNRNFGTVWRIPRPKVSKSHPTMKPVALVERSLAGVTPAGAVVLDPYAGSGTTGVACERMGRSARLVEKDPRYADAILKRLQLATGSSPVGPDGKEVDFS